MSGVKASVRRRALAEGCGGFNKPSGQKKPQLVALLSDRSNNFGNDLYDSAPLFINYIELAEIVINNKKCY